MLQGDDSHQQEVNKVSFLLYEFWDRPTQAVLQRPPLDALVKPPAHPALAKCLLELGVLPCFPVSTGFPRGLALAIASALLNQPVAWIGARSLAAPLRDFLPTQVDSAIKAAGAHPSLDMLIAPVLAALTKTTLAPASKPAERDYFMAEDGDEDGDDILHPLHSLQQAWLSTTELWLFTVRAERLGFAKLKGPCSTGQVAFLWGVYDAPPEPNDVRALHRLHDSLHTAEYQAGMDWLRANLNSVDYGVWLWARR